jgi:hypothetical protein
MASSSGHALDSKQIHEKLRNDSDSFSEFSQDSDIDIIDHVDPDAEISGPDLSDSGSNSDDGEASANVGSDNDEDGDNEDWALGDENDHNFYKIQMPVSPHQFLMLYLVQL